MYGGTVSLYCQTFDDIAQWGQCLYEVAFVCNLFSLITVVEFFGLKSIQQIFQLMLT